MHCCIPTLATDNNTSTGMIWVTLNMPSAAEECHELSGNFTLSGVVTLLLVVYFKVVLETLNRIWWFFCYFTMTWIYWRQLFCCLSGCFWILSHMTYAVLVISTTRSHPPCSFCSQMMFFCVITLSVGVFYIFSTYTFNVGLFVCKVFKSNC